MAAKSWTALLGPLLEVERIDEPHRTILEFTLGVLKSAGDLFPPDLRPNCYVTDGAVPWAAVAQDPISGYHMAIGGLFPYQLIATIPRLRANLACPGKYALPWIATASRGIFLTDGEHTPPPSSSETFSSSMSWSLAFAALHELAHVVLGHLEPRRVPIARSTFVQGNETDIVVLRQRRELDADTLACEIALEICVHSDADLELLIRGLTTFLFIQELAERKLRPERSHPSGDLRAMVAQCVLCRLATSEELVRSVFRAARKEWDVAGWCVDRGPAELRAELSRLIDGFSPHCSES